MIIIVALETDLVYLFQFDLVCEDNYQRATITSVYMIGALFGAPLGGYLADR